MKVVCIDDKNRPNEVPANRWIEEGKEYTVTEVCKMNVQGGIEGVKLNEINNDDLAPYQYFRASRFVPLDWVVQIEEETEEIHA